MARRYGTNVETNPDAEMTEAQKLFVREYVYDFNATQAYLKAYPHCTYLTARVEASKLLARPNVQKEVEAAKRAQAEECKISVRRVLREISELAFSDQGNYFVADESDEGMPKPKPFNKINAGHRKAISSIKIKRRRLKSDKDKTAWEVEEVEYKLHDKNKALDKLCQRLGITKDGAAYDELVKLLAGVAKENKPADDAGTGSKGKRS